MDVMSFRTRVLAAATEILGLAAITGTPETVAADLGTVTWSGTTPSKNSVPHCRVAIAHRQVDRSWGAYELLAADGSMTGVFLPEGGYALVSGSTTLTPVWSR
jgi:hypothetical protein